MRLVYVLLSPTFGMHQYTADLANRATRENEVHLVTTEKIPSDRYRKEITVHQTVHFSSTGLSIESIKPKAIQAVRRKIIELEPDIVHFTGPHLWNLYLIRWLRTKLVSVIHTIHDLDAHEGARFGRLLTFWNQTVLRFSSHIVVHNKHYYSRLLANGLDEKHVTWLPLLHMFFSYQRAAEMYQGSRPVTGQVAYEGSALFFGRIEGYKGIEILLEAVQKAKWEYPIRNKSAFKLIIAGKGDMTQKWAGSLPDNVEWRNRFINDNEAIDLFRRCSLVVLPYTGATQSAIVAAAYFFCKPVLVTDSGALEEYVVPGQTGFLVHRGDSRAMANALVDAFSPSTNLPEMGRSGRRWYDQHRKAETHELLRLYQSIYKESPNW